MDPKFHISLGLFFTFIIYLIAPSLGILGLLTIFLSTFLIDVDHYLSYAFSKKDANPLNSYIWHKENSEKLKKIPRNERNEISTGFYFLHGIEILIVLFVLGYFFNKFFLFFFIGFTFHIYLDLIYQPLYLDRKDKISIIFDFFKRRNLQKI